MDAAPPPIPPRESEPDGDASWGQWVSAGIDFGVAVAVFFFVGWWLDARWDTSPWMRIAGAGFGIVLGTYVLIRQALMSQSDTRTRPPGSGESSGGKGSRTRAP